MLRARGAGRRRLAVRGVRAEVSTRKRCASRGVAGVVPPLRPTVDRRKHTETCGLLRLAAAGRLGGPCRDGSEQTVEGRRALLVLGLSCLAQQLVAAGEHGDVCGAGEGIRTLDVHLGKVALYH
jgi:hypothetical protein